MSDIRVPTREEVKVRMPGCHGIDITCYQVGYEDALRAVAERMKQIQRCVKLPLEELVEWERVESHVNAALGDGTVKE